MSVLQTILVTGANGQLGSEFKFLASGYPQYRFIFVSKEELAINDLQAVEKYFTENKVDICINCAAYTAVDKAESEKEISLAINGTAVGYLAAACKKHNARFIHFSTDYVFDGLSEEEYDTDAPTNPVNYYGYTKLMGEQEAVKLNTDSIIIRTAWVYSRFGKNFVKTMMQLMTQKPSLNVVSDQYGRPSYAADIAVVVMKILESGKWIPGIYHCTNSGNIISWFDFATAIKEIANLNCSINPIPTSGYPTPAKRPGFSALAIDKIESLYSLQLPEWKNSLTDCIQILLKK